MQYNLTHISHSTITQYYAKITRLARFKRVTTFGGDNNIMIQHFNYLNKLINANLRR